MWRTDCKIVVSSTWRLGNTIEELRYFLMKRGSQSYHRIIGATINGFLDPEIRGFGERLERSKEIAHWLKHRGDVERFAIIDDDHDAGIGFAPQFVKTDVRMGMTDADANAVVAILNRGE